MELIGFDKYFANFPAQNRKDDFDQFWKKALNELKKITIRPTIKKNKKKSSQKFDEYDISFRGFMNSIIKGFLLIPVKKKKSPVIINIHDYNNRTDYSHRILNNEAAFLFLTMRGHDTIIFSNEEEKISPGYMVEHILDIETYYIKAAYLDTLRSVDTLRLLSELNCSKIGIMGKGIGAATALFTAAHSKRISALVLDTPAFCNLPLSQNISTSDASNEINNFIPLKKGKKNQIKKNLTYFDTINFTDKITCPVLTTAGFRDTISPPECIFGLFNRLQCEKTMEVYPEQGNRAGGEKQFIKSIEWLINRIHP